MSLPRLSPRRAKPRLVLAFIVAAGLAVRVAPGAPSPALASTGSGGALINEKFATAASISDFTLVAGTPWSAGGYALTLAGAVAAGTAPGNPNLLVHNTVISGDWTLTTRIAATSTGSGRDSYSIVAAYVDASDYIYANVSESAAPGQQGIYLVRGGSGTLLAAFPSSQFGAPDRHDDVTLTRAGTTLTFLRNGVQLASVSDPSASAGLPGRVGYGSRGSGISASHLLVMPAAGTAPQAPSPTATPTAAPTATPTPAPTAPPTPAPTATPTPNPTATPTPAPP
ncbi:MAG TPA: hypothetical protein VFO60_10080, partial [Candidatus Dormibacteraeota bacterium]|nr:hypothetical protein [Candidatus Dormibacteraeota bacterium]